MKNTKVCPKCNCNDIIVIKNDGHPDGSYGNNIQTKATILSGVVFVERFICCNCGYTEQWVDKADINVLLNSKKITR